MHTADLGGVICRGLEGATQCLEVATVTHVDGDVSSLRGAVVSSASRAACHDWGLEAGDLRHRLGKLALLYRYDVDVVAKKPGRQLRYPPRSTPGW